MDKHIKPCKSALERQIQIAQSLQETLAVINSNQELDEVLNFIVNQAQHILNAEASAIYALQERNGKLHIEASKGLSIEYIEEAIIPLGNGATGLASLSREPVAIEEFLNFEKYSNITVDDNTRLLVIKLAKSFQSLLSVPLIFSNGTVYGTINLYYQNARKFTEEDIALSRAYANQTILAIENARLKATVKSSAAITERNRLARELHDTVTQTLFSMSLITDVLPDLWKNDQELGRKALEELKQLSKGAVTEMRSLLFELKPNTLLSMELESLIQQLVDSFKAHTGINVDYDYQRLQCNLPADVKFTFYRVVQEALRNVVKHGHATNVKISLNTIMNRKKPINRMIDCETSDTQISVLIEDDGVGFYHGILTGEQYGIRIMYDRAREIGATFHLESEPGRGTRVSLVW